MKYTQYIIALVFLCGCSRHTNDFEKYLSQLDKIKLPFEFKELGNFNKSIPATQPDDSIFQKFKSVDASFVFGKLYENKNTVGIIYLVNGDALTPILLTYDMQGNRIDSLNFFKNATGYGPKQEITVSVTVYPDLTLHEIDSTTTWDLDAKEEQIPNSQRLSIDSNLFTIRPDGKIIKSFFH